MILPASLFGLSWDERHTDLDLLWRRHPWDYVSADRSSFDCAFQVAGLPPAVLTTSAPSGPETLHSSKAVSGWTVSRPPPSKLTCSAPAASAVASSIVCPTS